METQEHIIIYLNTQSNIVQFLSESNEQFKDRLELIKKLEKNNIDFNNAINISKIYYNVKYKKCKYTPFVYNRVKKYL